MTETSRPAADPERGRLLRERMQLRRVSIRELARRVGCDERTIKRACDGERQPQRGTAELISQALECTVDDLWPRSVGVFVPDASVVPARVFPSRSHMPREIWSQAFDAAEQQIDICVYGGTFLFDTVPGFLRTVRHAAERGVAVRFIVGDPRSAAVHQRGQEERIGDPLAARCRMSLAHLEAVHDLDGVQIRTHGSPLYVSMFFADDTVYANHHILGSPAGDNPVIEIRRSNGPELWETYRDSFDRIWADASPVHYPLGY